MNKKVFVLAEGGRAPTKNTLDRLKESEFPGIAIDIFAGLIYDNPSYLADKLDESSIIAYVNTDNFFELFGGDYVAKFQNALRESADSTSYKVCTEFVAKLAIA